MRKVVILQARLSSSRFPKKVLADLNGKPVVAHIIDRLRSAAHVDEVCVAIPVDPVEDDLAAFLADQPVTVVRGSQHDVLGRFNQAAYQTRADIIVRATADNPLVSPAEIDRQIETLEQNPELDYVITEGYPLGITTEAFTLKTLEKLDYLARHAHMREHVTLYLRENPGPFGVKFLQAPEELADANLRLTLDTRQDYDFLAAVYKELYREGELVDLAEVLELLRREPKLKEMSNARTAIPASA